MLFNLRKHFENQISIERTHTEHYKNEKTGTVIFVKNDENIAIGFKRKSTKTAFNYKFNSKAAMLNYIKEFTLRDESEQLEKELRVAERKAFVPEFEVGDIFLGSWGYDQTNNNFYQVIGKENKKAIVKELKQKLEYFEQMSLAGKAYPLPNEFYKEQEIKRIVQLGNRIKVDECITAKIIKPIGKSENGQPIYKGYYFSQTA